MADSYWTEGKHVGQLLAAHRTLLGVSLQGLIVRVPRLARTRIATTEDIETPDVGRLEDYHAALMTAYVHENGTRDVPASRREQWWSTSMDEYMFHQVLKDTPRTTWWWVIVNDGRGRGAWCNYCSALIHSYDAGSGVRRRARMIIMDHRAAHITDIHADKLNPHERTTP